MKNRARRDFPPRCTARFELPGFDDALSPCAVCRVLCCVMLIYAYDRPSNSRFSDSMTPPCLACVHNNAPQTKQAQRPVRTDFHRSAPQRLRLPGRGGERERERRKGGTWELIFARELLYVSAEGIAAAAVAPVDPFVPPHLSPANTPSLVGTTPSSPNFRG